MLVLGSRRNSLESVCNLLLDLFNSSVFLLSLSIELAGALDVFGDGLLETWLLLLEADDSGLKVVLLENLLVKLLGDSIV